jgi:hypothetical protein
MPYPYIFAQGLFFPYKQYVVFAALYIENPQFLGKFTRFLCGVYVLFAETISKKRFCRRLLFVSIFDVCGFLCFGCVFGACARASSLGAWRILRVILPLHKVPLQGRKVKS